MNYKFSSPATGLEFLITDEDKSSYITHAITGEKIPIVYDPERDILAIPGHALAFRELITVKEAVARYGLTKQAIHKAFAKGNIKGVKIKSMLLIDTLSADNRFRVRDD